MTAFSERSPAVSVIICAFADERLELTTRCVNATLAQEPAPNEVVVVIDHNPRLGSEFRDRFRAEPRVTVVENNGSQGLSDARNTGIRCSTGEIVAFLDDDATPHPGWLQGLIAGFEDGVQGVGGQAIPEWELCQPDWFPDPFLWVVGCSYEGQPATDAVRNPIGCNMAFRRGMFDRAGLFDTKIGRIGKRPLGCEETELCIRAAARIPGASFRMVDGAEVDHWVPAVRGTWDYLLRRCFYEGISKALITYLHLPAALGPESDYVMTTLTRDVGRSLLRAISGPQRTNALRRAVAVVSALTSAVAGYAVGAIWFRLRPPAHDPAI